MFLFSLLSLCTTKKVDSLTAIVKSLPDNETRLKVLKQLVLSSTEKPAIIIQYSKQGVTLAKKLNKPKYEISFLGTLEKGYYLSYNFSKQLDVYLEGLELSKQLRKDTAICYFYNAIVIADPSAG